MKMNAFEKMFTNNPIRKRMLVKNVRELVAGRPNKKLEDVLEIGCGFGAGVLAIDKVVSPKKVTAFDLDPKMVALALKNCKDVKAETIIEVGDGENLSYPDNSFDAVFEFTIFHHIPLWQKALAEVYRVLRPGGFFFFEELCREFHFDTPIISFLQQNFTVHPWETIPDVGAFIKGIKEAGLDQVKYRKTYFNGWLLGSSQKPARRRQQ